MEGGGFGSGVALRGEAGVHLGAVRTPLLAEALAAGGPGRAGAAFDLALAGFLTYARTLLGGSGDNGDSAGTGRG